MTIINPITGLPVTPDPCIASITLASVKLSDVCQYIREAVRLGHVERIRSALDVAVAENYARITVVKRKKGKRGKKLVTLRTTRRG